jgi:hypothetical protein
MAVTTEKSAQINNAEAAPVVLNDNVDVYGKLRVAVFDFTQGAAAGDATSTMDLAVLPHGNIRILPELSHIAFSAFGASRTLDIGFLAYTDWKSAAVVADPNYFATAIDVSSAGAAKFSEALTAPAKPQYRSKDGLTVQATVAGGTIPAGATLTGFIVYVQQV